VLDSVKVVLALVNLDKAETSIATRPRVLGSVGAGRQCYQFSCLVGIASERQREALDCLVGRSVE
jgi:hypothetical protein